MYVRRFAMPARPLGVQPLSVLAATALLVGLGGRDAVPLVDGAPPTAAAATSPAYGAQSLGATSYPVPAGAIFVSPTGSDRGSGKLASPYRTLRKAVLVARSGSTIVLRRGTYHEYVTWYRKRLTVQPYPGEQVVFDGSVPVRGWVADSSRLWHVNGWTARFKHGGRRDLIYASHPYAAYPDMVFRDGIPLRQVGRRLAVTAGTFYADYANRRLYVGSSPVGRRMAGSTLSRAMYVNHGTGSIVRGLVFQRYATHPDLIAAVIGTGSGLRFDNDVFRDNAAIGLSVLANSSKVLNSTFGGNGQMGLHSHRASGLVIQGNWMHHNNTEHFSVAAAEGGLKVTNGSHQLWADNLSEDNYGDGLWCDRHSSYITIVRNVVRRNNFRGIKCEISAHVIVASNLVVNNKTYGILNNESNDYQIWNNTLVGNGRGIEATDYTRHSSSVTFPEDVRAFRIRNNVIANANTAWPKPPALLAIEDYTHRRNAAQMGVTADYNAYYRSVGTRPKYVVMWSAYPVPGLIRSTSLAAFRSRTGQEAHGLAGDNIGLPFVNIGAGDYRLRLGTAPKAAGQPLPPAIAAAIGVPAGKRVDMGILR